MNSRIVLYSAVLYWLAVCAVAQEKEAPPVSEPAVPTEEHQWLQQLVGEWRVVRVTEAPGVESVKTRSHETIRALDELWIVIEGSAKVGTTGMTSLQTLGYDPKDEKFVGTWIGGAEPYLWEYEGNFDKYSDALVLETRGPSLAGDGEEANFREVFEITGNDQRTFTSFQQQEDGSWKELVKITYARK